MQRALLTALTIFFVIACAGPADHFIPGSPGSLAQMTPAQRERAQSELEPYEAAFASLDAALRARDDSLAQRILLRIHARGPRGAALARARAYDRILEGREWVASLGIRLEAKRQLPGDQWIVSALASNIGADDLTLRGAPPSLRMSLIGVSPEGLEQRYSVGTIVESLSRWHLPAGVETAQEVGHFEIPPGEALAVRANFTLEFLPGDVWKGSEVRPAAEIPIARADVIRLADFLPTEPVDPQELARYVREEMIRTAPLLERAVRIPVDQRALALDLLTVSAMALPSGELEKITVALRWLSGRQELGADSRSWRQWLDERARARAQSASEALGEGSALELPDSPTYRR